MIAIPEAHRETWVCRIDPQLGIGAELYGLWLESLLATVAECDADYGPEIERAWRAVMGVGIEYMLRHYEDARDDPR